MVSKTIPVQIDAETYTAAKAYADLTGIPVARVVRAALKDWMETVGAARLETLTGRNNLVVMPLPIALAE